MENKRSYRTDGSSIYTSVIYKLLVYKNFCYMNDLATRQYYIDNKKVYFRQSDRRRNKGAV